MKKFANALDRNPFTRALVYALGLPPSRRIYRELVERVLARVGEIRLRHGPGDRKRLRNAIGIKGEVLKHEEIP